MDLPTQGGKMVKALGYGLVRLNYVAMSVSISGHVLMYLTLASNSYDILNAL